MKRAVKFKHSWSWRYFRCNFLELSARKRFLNNEYIFRSRKFNNEFPRIGEICKNKPYRPKSFQIFAEHKQTNLAISELFKFLGNISFATILDGIDGLSDRGSILRQWLIFIMQAQSLQLKALKLKLVANVKCKTLKRYNEGLQSTTVIILV